MERVKGKGNDVILCKDDMSVPGDMLVPFLSLPCYFTIFSKGNNFYDFLFASLDDVSFQNGF